MKQMRPTLKKDYSGLFVGTILMGAGGHRI